MVIIRVCGGLGNQLFQFALYEKMCFWGKDVYLDKSLYESRKEKRHYCLDKLNNYIRYCSNKQRKQLSNSDNNRISCYFQKKRGLKESHYYEKQRTFYDEEIFSLDNAYLDGYWQNEKYFCDIRDTFLKELHFNVSEDAMALLKEIQSCNAVSIHVRRGDYLKDSRRCENICTLEYYKRAMDFVEERATVDKYYIFSDDIEWCREQFKDDSRYTFVNPRSEKEAAADMKLMSYCKHNIIANSSFSWWAAWINENPQKIVVAPKVWIKGQDVDIWCSGWQKLSEERDTN